MVTPVLLLVSIMYNNKNLGLYLFIVTIILYFFIFLSHKDHLVPKQEESVSQNKLEMHSKNTPTVKKSNKKIKIKYLLGRISLRKNIS